MTDLSARLAAAIQQVRTSTPRECDDGLCRVGLVHSVDCDERWATRVDARLAACVEAAMTDAIETAMPQYHGDGSVTHESRDTSYEAGLAAFLAAAAQKETR